MSDILAQAQDILGPPVRVETHRSWAVFWCPFHHDTARAGQGGKPNFGVQIEAGFWKCLRCGQAGTSLRTLSEKLGTRQVTSLRPARRTPRPQAQPKPQLEHLDAAVAETRAALINSPAAGYLRGRGLKPLTWLRYGLGYGLANPEVNAKILKTAQEARLVRHTGTWLWAGGVVYADPTTQPRVLNVRYLPEEILPSDARDFTPPSKHKTWGRRTFPLGLWRVQPTTQMVVVVEGLFDMLVFAQTLQERGLEAEVLAVYTNGASPARPILDWFATSPYAYLLIPDPDPAGEAWIKKVIVQMIQHGVSLGMIQSSGQRNLVAEVS